MNFERLPTPLSLLQRVHNTRFLWHCPGVTCLLFLPLLTAFPAPLRQEEVVEESADETQRILYDFQEIEVARVLTILVIAWAAVLLSRLLLRWLANRLPARFRLHILPLVPVLRLLFITVALFRIFPLLFNITSSNIITVLGALGVAIGFAFKDYVSSLLAGIIVIYERPYRVGDWITLDEYYGEVTNIGVRALQLVTPDDTTVTIPHAKLWNNNIANANDGLREHQCIAHFYLHPAHDARLVRQKLWDVGMTSPYTKLARVVTVVVQEKPWGTHYQLKAYPIDGRDEFQYISDLTVRGKAALAAIGVQPALIPIGLQSD